MSSMRIGRRSTRTGIAAAMLAAGCSVQGNGPSDIVSSITQPIVFGHDDRVEFDKLSDPQWIVKANATAALFPLGSVHCNSASCDLATYPFDSGQVGSEAHLPLCSDEPFRGQAKGASCTAFLVGEDLFATAGHCIRSQAACEATRVVFGFTARTPPGTANTTVPAGNVYACTQLIAQYYPGGETTDDFAVFRVNRSVSGRTALPLRSTGTIPDGTELIAFGHIQGLPLKATTAGTVRENYPSFPKFQADLDSSPGSSGSPVLNRNTGLVEGIVTSGPTPDFVAATDVDASPCARSRVCAVEGCSAGPFPQWIGVTRIQSVVAALEGRSCHDWSKNGKESDVDCGGDECTPCGLGKTCRENSDCGFDLLCEASTCIQAPECTKGSDCVGPMTPACAVGVCENNECRLDYDNCECTTHAQCNDGDPCTEDICFGRTMACIHVPGHCPSCTEETAIDLGEPGQTKTVPTNACLRIRDGYPAWWGANRTMILQTTGSNSYPVAFTWSNACGTGSGSGTFIAPWQEALLSPTSSACTTLIALQGNGSGSVSLWYFGR